MRNERGGGGEKRKPFSSPHPLALPIFLFAFAPTFAQELDWKRLLRRLLSSAEACFSPLARAFSVARVLARSLVPWPTFICSFSAPLKRYPGPITTVAVVRGKRENQGSFVRNSFHVKGLTRKADSMRRMIVRRTNKRNLGGMKEVEGTTSCC